MARETSGGRIGRTVYLPPELWARLERLAAGSEQHPAFRGWEIRSGSTSSVIERILSWDAPAEIQRLRQQVADLQAKVEVVRQLQGQAGNTAALLDARMSDLRRLLRQLAELQV